MKIQTMNEIEEENPYHQPSTDDIEPEPIDFIPIQWHLQTWKISKLKDYPKNPRILTKDQEAQLRISLNKFGLIDKIIINTDGMIIGGHQRKRTLKKLGYKEIEVNVPSRTLTDKEVEELNIRLNRVHGNFDYDILANEYEATDLINWGFTVEEITGDFESLDDPDSTEPKKDKKKHKCPSCGCEFV